MISFHCRRSPVLLSPYPDQIETIQGFASLKTQGTESFSRSKFSFLFSLPDKARIEVFDFLGRTIYQIFVDGEKAFLVVPSKKIYWQSTAEEIIDKFIGCQLSLFEAASFFSGQWEYLKEKAESRNRNSWEIQKDREGRVTRGEKQGMTFQVNDYIENTDLIQSLSFENRFQEGQLKILRIDFNNPVQESLFSLSFIKSHQRKSWDEVREVISHES
ncbi:MAG: lipoprotein insertase outer membrane protein LolB [Acidobacteriota bacterium]